MKRSHVITASRYVAVVLTALFLFLGYSYLALSVPDVSASPDENANRTFATHFAHTGKLHAFDRLNQLLTENQLVPRSVRVVDDLTVPAGFIGIPLFYGGVAKAFGVGILPFLTPLLAVAAVYAWGALIGTLYDRRIGRIAALLLATNAAWWYWSARALMPNVPFLAFTIFAAYFIVVAPIRRLSEHRGGHVLAGLADDALAGISLGFALGIRLSEAYWIVVAVMVAMVAVRRVPWKQLLLVGMFALAALAPVFIMNDALYGDWLAAGYSGAQTRIAEEGVGGGFGQRILGPIAPYLFPLGFAPRTAYAHFLSFGLGLFSHWTFAVLVSLLVLGAYAWNDKNAQMEGREEDRGAQGARKAFLWGGIATAVWLVLLYGSWTVRDNPDPTAVTIGASYVRYWLPIFALSTVPVALATSRLITEAGLKRVGGILLLAACVVTGPWFAFSAPQEGLDRLHDVLVEDRMVRDDVLQRTEEKSVIIVDRADKFMYPARRVMYPLRDERTYRSLPTLSRFAPLYYLGITLPQRDVDWLNEMKLPPLGLQIMPVETYGERTLYALPKLVDIETP